MKKQKTNVLPLFLRADVFAEQSGDYDLVEPVFKVYGGK